MPVHVARQAGELPGTVLRAAGREDAADRQVWSAGGSAMVEIRGLDRDDENLEELFYRLIGAAEPPAA